MGKKQTVKEKREHLKTLSCSGLLPKNLVIVIGRTKRKIKIDTIATLDNLFPHSKSDNYSQCNCYFILCYEMIDDEKLLMVFSLDRCSKDYTRHWQVRLLPNFTYEL